MFLVNIAVFSSSILSLFKFFSFSFGVVLSLEGNTLRVCLFFWVHQVFLFKIILPIALIQKSVIHTIEVKCDSGLINRE